MGSRLIKKFAAPLVLCALVLFSAGCERDPLEPEEHPEAAGVVILRAGSTQVLARSNAANQPFDNSIVVPLNGTLDVEIRYIDENDPNNFFLPDTDEGESTRVTIANGAVASYTEAQAGGNFRGLSAGTTTATIALMHGGHADFQSGPLTITVQ